MKKEKPQGPHQKDISSKQLEEYPDVFADILNVLMFHGKTMLLPEYMEERFNNAFFRDINSVWHEHRRDVAMADQRSGVVLSVISIENQAKQDKDMVFRVMGYDFAGYQKQLASKDARRSPVFTLVIYFGPGSWTQPRQLLDALNLADVPYREDLMQAVSNHHINVVEISQLSPEVRRQFRSDFRLVAECFRADRQNLEQDLLGISQRIQHPEAFWDFLMAFFPNQLTSSQKAAIRQRLLEQTQKEKGGLTVKSFLDELLDKGEQRGLEKGLAEGQRQIVGFMLKSEKDLGKIAALTGLPLETVRKLAEVEEKEG